MAGIDYWEENVLQNGMSIPVAQLLIDGWATGSDAAIAALDQYAYTSGDRFITETILHLRRVYKKSMFIGAPASANNLIGGSVSAEKVRRDFRRKPLPHQYEILKDCIFQLHDETDFQGRPMFANKQDWIAVFLVVTTRLGIHKTQKDFPAYAANITPDGFPEKLTISPSTISNISHLGLPDTPYFMWTDRQMARHAVAARINMLCARLWSLIEQKTYELS